MRNKPANLLKYLLAAAAFILVFAVLQQLLMPKYHSASREGNLIAEYYQETREHDVLFIGDCEVYGNFSPAVLWEEYGLTSYIRGSAEQLIWQSYYLLEEMLEKEAPKAVIFNVLSMKHNEADSEAYNRMTLDGMKLSRHKIASVKASMTGDESFISYLFPLLRFHSRWNELAEEDFRYLFKRPSVSFNGYMPRVDVKPMGAMPAKRPLPDYRFGENAMYYLEKMAALCEEKGTELILIKAPVVYPYWYDEWDAQIREFADAHSIAYYNLLDLTDEAGIDFSADTYDGGLHLNVSGAEKATRFLGSLITGHITVPDHESDTELKEIWSEKLRAYHAEIARQQQELADTGSISFP